MKFTALTSIVTTVAIYSIAQPAAAQTFRNITQCGYVKENVRLVSDLVTPGSTCLTVKANGIIIDGNGKNIQAVTYAISLADYADVVIQNVKSAQLVQIYGSKAHRNTITGSTLGSVGIYRGDWNVVERSYIGRLTIVGQSNDPAQYATVRYNTFEGTLTGTEQKLVRVTTGVTATAEPDGTKCAVGGHLITQNRLVANVTAGEPELLHYGCGRGSVISDNVIETAGLAIGLVMRDEADDNQVVGNRISVGQGGYGALLIQSGVTGYHHPRNNNFDGNVFKAASGRSFFLQAYGSTENIFQHNVFWTQGGSVEGVRITDGASTRQTFHHNTFYHGGTGTGIVFRNLGVSLGVVEMHSNIFGYRNRRYFGFDKLYNLVSYNGNHNVFYDLDGVTNVTDLLSWQTLSVEDLSSVVANPLFVDESNGDYHLKSGWPACNVNGAGPSGAYPCAG